MAAAEEWTPQTDDDGPQGPEFEPILPLKPKKRWGLRIGILAVLLIAGGAGAGWYLWGSQLFLDPDADIPMVRADGGPIKVRPESPGGMDVPDRDKLVYDRLEGNGERPTIERLLPTPEIPMNRPEPAPKPPAAQAQSPMPQKSESEVVTAVPETRKPMESAAVPAPPAPPPPPAPADAMKSPPAAQIETPPPPPMPETTTPTVAEVLTAMRPPPAPQAEKPEPVMETPAPKQPATASAPTKPAPKASTNGGYRIQLAAVRERAAVDSEWDRLRRRHSDLLGSLKLTVMRADLGPTKGVYFRLRAGPIADEAQAKALCKQLAERKVGCLVVRPEG
jgi:sporulation related protein